MKGTVGNSHCGGCDLVQSLWETVIIMRMVMMTKMMMRRKTMMMQMQRHGGGGGLWAEHSQSPSSFSSLPIFTEQS